MSPFFAALIATGYMGVVFVVFGFAKHRSHLLAERPKVR